MVTKRDLTRFIMAAFPVFIYPYFPVSGLSPRYLLEPDSGISSTKHPDMTDFCVDFSTDCHFLTPDTCRGHFEDRYNYWCPRTCGVCRDCVDKVSDCSLFGDDICTRHRSWAVEFCPKSCRFCGESCKDLYDCHRIGKNACSLFPDFANADCREYCGLCSKVLYPARLLNASSPSTASPTPKPTLATKALPTTTTTTKSIPTTATSSTHVCNKFTVIIAVANGNVMTHPGASICSNGKHAQSEAVVLDACAAPDPPQWTAGQQVMAHCEHIPIYSPISTFVFGSYPRNSMGMSGVLLGCLSNGFKAAFQVCGNPPRIVNVTVGGANYISDASNFNVVQW